MNVQQITTAANNCVVTQRAVITASVTRDTRSALIGTRVKVKGKPSYSRALFMK